MLIEELEKLKKKRLDADEQRLKEAERSLGRVYAEQVAAFEEYKAGGMEKADYLEKRRKMDEDEAGLEGVDVEILAKVMTNPEMAALLASLTKAMESEGRQGLSCIS